jgi:peroxiredoxin Q/BCP
MNEMSKAPDFSLPDQEGKIHSLKEYLGKKVLVYFYPKDMTPGCTAEAKCFRDRLNDFKSAGVQVLGISVDSVDSHKKFAEAHHLNFPLLSDMNKKVVQDYGVWGEKSFMGKKYMGIQRDSFLIDEKGNLLKHYQKVDPKTHPEEILKDLAV